MKSLEIKQSGPRKLNAILFLFFASTVLIGTGIVLGAKTWSSPIYTICITDVTYAPAEKGVPWYHTVAPMENLSKIIRLYGVTVWAIVEANGIRNPDLIYVGQVLLIPPPIKPPEPYYVFVKPEGPSEMRVKESAPIMVTAQITATPSHREGVLPINPSLTYTATLVHTGEPNIKILSPLSRPLSRQEPSRWTGTIYASEEWEGRQIIKFKVLLCGPNGQAVTQDDLPYADYELKVQGRRDWMRMLAAFVFGGGGLAGYLGLFLKIRELRRQEKAHAREVNCEDGRVD